MEEKENLLNCEENINEENIKKQKTISKKDMFKEKECQVIKYDKSRKTLDVLFDQYGIRIFNVENFNGDTTTVKYKSEIGKSDFICIL